MNNQFKFRPIELILFLVIILSLLLKEFRIPGATATLILSVALLSMAYFRWLIFI